MNRKLLVLPALLGLAAPVLAGCGDSTGGGGGGDAIVIGSTDPLEMSADQPSPSTRPRRTTAARTAS